MHQFNATVSLIDDDTNFCVYVPEGISNLLTPAKGSIYVEGTVNGVPFTKHLRRYKGNPWHLYINLKTLKAAGAKPGDTVAIAFEQHPEPVKQTFEVPASLGDVLTAHGLSERFVSISQGRKQAILKYLYQIKSDMLRDYWINQIIIKLSRGETKFIIPFKREDN